MTPQRTSAAVAAALDAAHWGQRHKLEQQNAALVEALRELLSILPPRQMRIPGHREIAERAIAALAEATSTEKE